MVRSNWSLPANQVAVVSIRLCLKLSLPKQPATADF